MAYQNNHSRSWAPSMPHSEADLSGPGGEVILAKQKALHDKAVCTFFNIWLKGVTQECGKPSIQSDRLNKGRYSITADNTEKLSQPDWRKGYPHPGHVSVFNSWRDTQLLTLGRLQSLVWLTLDMSNQTKEGSSKSDWNIKSQFPWDLMMLSMCKICDQQWCIQSDWPL